MKKERKNSTIEDDDFTLRDFKYIAVFFIVGLGVPYLVQFELNFLGATLVTLKDVIGLWVTSIVVTLGILLQIYSRK